MQITWEFLRSIGFRFVSSSVDRVPHMVCSVHQNQEVGLEISPCYGSHGSWFVWLRRFREYLEGQRFSRVPGGL